MAIIQGYDGSRHSPTHEVASRVKRMGHKKEEIFAERLGDIKYVVKGRQKPDVIKEDLRYSIKGADKNIQLLLSKLNKSEQFYGSNNPVYKFQLAGYKHRKFKFENNDMVDTELFDAFFNAAENAANWLRNKNNFRFVIEKVFSDNYDANKLVVLKEIDEDAIVYNMKDVVNLYVNSNYEVNVTDGAKITVYAENREIFYLEIRGGKDHCGSMNHGVRAYGLYPFIKENLTYEVVSA